MNRTQSNFMLVVGFLITFGGVGGIENSVTDTELVQSLLVSIVGLAIAGCGVLAMRVLDSQEV
jgi:hypothetical protein